MTRGLDRLESRIETLLELAEDRLIEKREFAARKARLEAERNAALIELDTVEAKLRARADSAGVVDATLVSLRRLSDVYDELDEIAERRRLLESCLTRLVVADSNVELHTPVYPALVVRLETGQ